MVVVVVVVFMIVVIAIAVIVIGVFNMGIVSCFVFHHNMIAQRQRRFI